MSAKKVIYLRVPAELHDTVLRQAIATDRSINAQAVRLIKKGLELQK